MILQNIINLAAAIVLNLPVPTPAPEATITPEPPPMSVSQRDGLTIYSYQLPQDGEEEK